MIEENAIGIVSKYGIGQRGVKIGAVNLAIASAAPFHIIGSARPDFYDLARLEVAYQVRFGGSGLFGNPFADAKEVKRVHRVRRDNYACSNLSKFPSLLEHRNAMAKMLQGERRT